MGQGAGVEEQTHRAGARILRRLIGGAARGRFGADAGAWWQLSRASGPFSHQTTVLEAALPDVRV